jgi:eukaryotic-like serine/threonine-protein kinase
MNFTVENICGLMIRSKLLTPPAVKALAERWQREGRDNVKNVQKFAQWLIGQQILTEYQARLLLKGQADHFFLNQYKILDRLGQGRMAGVYKAVHPSRQTLAIKVLPPSKAKDAQLLARFQREARLALKLKHPNVVRSFQVGEAGGLNFLVMEYLEGETLEDVLRRRKKLPPNEAVRIVHQALLGLQHLAEQNMVHRDLKPANLMLIPARAHGEPDTTTAATVKILDIGLGREMYDENAPQQDTGLTREGALLGTPDYLAPEQARDPRTIDVRADIYSLGCVLYHALTGQPPFPDEQVLSQIIRHATESAKPLKDFIPNISDGLQQIVSTMLAKQPGQRYATPEAAARALQLFLVAEATPRNEEESPEMQGFLSWLESGGKENEARTPPESRLPPAVPVGTPASRNLPRPQLPIAVPRATGSTPAPSEYDVELVTEPEVLGTRRGFGRRNWILFALAAIGVLAAVMASVIFLGN